MAEDTGFELQVKMIESILQTSAAGALEDLDRLLFKEKGSELLAACKDESGRTALHMAAANGHQECVESLLAAGHAWNSVDDEYVSAGEMAQKNGHDIIYELLLQAGIRTELLLSMLEGRDDDEFEDFVEEDQILDSAANGSSSKAPEDEEVDGVVEEFDEEGEPIKSDSEARKEVDYTAMSSNQAYLKTPLNYSEDQTKLLDADNNAVMMGWEGPLMVEHAKVLCQRPDLDEERQANLHILNVGFGLGLIDDAIQSHTPARHTIVEAHPDVYAKMLADGWDQRPGVTILFGRWQDVLERGDFETYDGIFWDTFGEHYRDQKVFHEALPFILNEGGIFSFFNGLGGTNSFFHDVYCRIVELEFEELGYSTEYVPMDMDPSEAKIWDGVKRRYWSLAKYNLPIIRAL